MQMLTDLLQFTTLVNFLKNDNSQCCCTKETKTESAHHQQGNYGSRPAGHDTVHIESMDPRRNKLKETAKGSSDHPSIREEALQGNVLCLILFLIFTNGITKCMLDV